MIELTKEALLTATGIAAFVALVIQLLVKPALKRLEGREYYGLILNGIAVGLGIVAAFVARAAIAPVEFDTAVDAVLAGIEGGALAIFGYEGVKNILAVVKPPQ